MVDPFNRTLSGSSYPGEDRIGCGCRKLAGGGREGSSRVVKSGGYKDAFHPGHEKDQSRTWPLYGNLAGCNFIHAPPSGVRRLCMELINLRAPVYFGHPENDPVQVAIVLGAEDGRSHITALLELNRMMQDQIARSAIRNTVHKWVVLHWVSRYSNSTEL